MNDTSIYAAAVAKDLKAFSSWVEKKEGKMVRAPGRNVAEIKGKSYVFIPSNNLTALRGRTFTAVVFIDQSATEQFKEVAYQRVRDVQTAKT